MDEDSPLKTKDMEITFCHLLNWWIPSFARLSFW